MVYIESQKSPKTRDLHHLRRAAGTHLNSGGCPTLGSLSHGSHKPGQVDSVSLHIPRDQPEKEREGEGAKERIDTGAARLVQKPPSNFFI